MRIVLTVVFALVAALPLSAQRRDRAPDEIPSAYRPPPGMCRIWIDGLPPSRQPEPTDCATAVRERPAGARVIFGDRVSREQPRGIAKGYTRERDDDDDDERRPARPERDDDDRRRRGAEACDGDDCDDDDRARPGAWPRMQSAVAHNEGRRTDDVARWLGTRAGSVRYEDRDGNGRPERVTWYDAAGRVLQVWSDADRDGIADTVRLYRNGRLVRVYEK